MLGSQRLEDRQRLARRGAPCLGVVHVHLEHGKVLQARREFGPEDLRVAGRQLAPDPQRLVASAPRFVQQALFVQQDAESVESRGEIGEEEAWLRGRQRSEDLERLIVRRLGLPGAMPVVQQATSAGECPPKLRPINLGLERCELPPRSRCLVGHTLVARRLSKVVEHRSEIVPVVVGIFLRQRTVDCHRLFEGVTRLLPVALQLAQAAQHCGESGTKGLRILRCERRAVFDEFTVRELARGRILPTLWGGWGGWGGEVKITAQELGVE